MDPATTRKAVEMVGGKFQLEASAASRWRPSPSLPRPASTTPHPAGVTHSAPNLDVALDIEI